MIPRAPLSEGAPRAARRPAPHEQRASDSDAFRSRGKRARVYPARARVARGRCARSRFVSRRTRVLCVQWIGVSDC